MTDHVTPERDGIVRWNCSSRCWQEGGPHDEGCKPTRYYHEGDYDSLAAQLEEAREQVRVLREALERISDGNDPLLGIGSESEYARQVLADTAPQEKP